MVRLRVPLLRRCCVTPEALADALEPYTEYGPEDVIERVQEALRAGETPANDDLGKAVAALERASERLSSEDAHQEALARILPALRRLLV